VHRLDLLPVSVTWEGNGSLLNTKWWHYVTFHICARTHTLPAWWLWWPNLYPGGFPSSGGHEALLLWFASWLSETMAPSGEHTITMPLTSHHKPGYNSCSMLTTQCTLPLTTNLQVHSPSDNQLANQRTMWCILQVPSSDPFATQCRPISSLPVPTASMESHTFGSLPCTTFLPAGC